MHQGLVKIKKDSPFGRRNQGRQSFVKEKRSANVISFKVMFLLEFFSLESFLQDFIAFVAAIWGANAGQFGEDLGEPALA